jgi:hypothetical protein
MLRKRELHMEDIVIEATKPEQIDVDIIAC